MTNIILLSIIGFLILLGVIINIILLVMNCEEYWNNKNIEPDKPKLLNKPGAIFQIDRNNEDKFVLFYKKTSAKKWHKKKMKNISKDEQPAFIVELPRIPNFLRDYEYMIEIEFEEGIDVVDDRPYNYDKDDDK